MKIEEKSSRLTTYLLVVVGVDYSNSTIFNAYLEISIFDENLSLGFSFGPGFITIRLQFSRILKGTSTSTYSG